MFDTTNVRPLASVKPCHEGSACATPCDACQVRLVSVCAALDVDELEQLETIAQHAVIQPRSMVFHEADIAHTVYTITSGTVKLYKDLPDGRRQVVGFALPGDFLGLALADRFGFSAEALTKATLCRFDRKRFTTLVETKPALIRRLHQVASHELALAQEQMVILGRRRADERLACFLVRWRERLTRLQPDSPTLPLPMGRQDIADHLGLTIETVSRTVSRFARERLILNVPDGVRVLDARRLAALAVG